MRAFKCMSCGQPLAARGQRCRGCGWSVDYDPRATRRERLAIAGGASALLAAILVGAALAYLV